MAFSPPIRIRPNGEMIKNKIKQVRAIIDNENKVSNKSRIRSRVSTKIDVDVSGKEFLRDENGKLIGIKTVKVDKDFKEIKGTEQTWKADLIFLAMGFLGPEDYLNKKLKHEISIIVDRVILNSNLGNRLADSVESAINLSNGLLVVEYENESLPKKFRKLETVTFSSKFSCPESGFTIEEIEP